MTSESEYAIHAKVKNNLILSRIMARAKTVRSFCISHGLRPSEVGDYVNLKQSGLNSSMEWRPSALALAEALGVLPEEIFDEEQRHIALHCNEVCIDVRRREIQDMLSGNTGFDFDLERRDFVSKMFDGAGLSNLQRAVFVKCALESEWSMERFASSVGLGPLTAKHINREAMHKLLTYIHAAGLSKADVLK